MDRLQGHDVAHEEEDFDPFDDAAIDAPLPVTSQDRRMQVRAYDYWASLLGERDLPSIGDLSPEQLKEFGPHCLLLDCSQGIDNPAIAYLGSALEAECRSSGDISHLADVPTGSLLSRLADPYRHVFARMFPVAFESDFVNERGAPISYRGLLMPFASDGNAIDFILGVLTWKERASVGESDAIAREMQASMRSVSPSLPISPLWASGPERGVRQAAAPTGSSLSVADRLALARTGSARARAREARGKSALHDAISLAHDLALASRASPEEYARLLAEAGVAGNDEHVGAVVAQLVFGSHYSEAEVGAFARALDHAMSIGTGMGELAGHLLTRPGGLEALAQKAPKADAGQPLDDTLIRLGETMDLAHMATDDDGHVVMIAQRDRDGTLTLLHALSPTSKAARDAIASTKR